MHKVNFPIIKDHEFSIDLNVCDINNQNVKNTKLK